MLENGGVGKLGEDGGKCPVGPPNSDHHHIQQQRRPSDGQQLKIRKGNGWSGGWRLSLMTPTPISTPVHKHRLMWMNVNEEEQWAKEGQRGSKANEAGEG
ncbi:hypothetical protein niasHT_024210 [Heterodera trifolii]|uniref:Uncharacterized protein n=1 Tax=Heterodera trifolii TaxID=157864 RepID=A0ABD2JMG3_9BILA